MKKVINAIACAAILFACSNTLENSDSELAKKILEDSRLDTVLEKAKETLKPEDGRFQAGSNYAETWIRDYATFLEVALEVNSKDLIKERMMLFFDFQGEDGDIIDGYTELKNEGGYDYRYSETAPNLKGHKNTVETDQESSLILAIARYINATGDKEILNEVKNGKTVLERCEMALNFLKEKMYSEKYGLIYGATTIDWTDVQPESSWGVFITEDTHWCVDVYDNAIYVLAINEYLQWIKDKEEKYNFWYDEKESIKVNVRKYLWDEQKQKFIPHRYLEDSPFSGFDEDEIFYFGGTVYAILAGFLNEDEIEACYRKMLAVKELSCSMTIAIINYPPYPDGSFYNEGGTKPYVYVNAADWTWWGGRAIEAMVKTGHLDLAYQEISPFLDRVIKNKGFYEWYSVLDHQPHGSNTFLGAAGALGKAIKLMKEEAIRKNNSK
jgi:glycogen debranching enzyme